MLLTIDVGNTQTVLGLYDPDTETGDGAAVGLVDHWRISTVHERTSDEYSVMVRSMLDTTDVDFDTEITGTAICSGVPRILANLRQMVNRYLPNEPIVIEPGVKTGMPILYDNPKEVGADRIANANRGLRPLWRADGGRRLRHRQQLRCDLRERRVPRWRSRHRDQPRCPLWPCRPVACDRARRTSAVVGKSTVESIQSGTVYGFAAMIDGMVRRFGDALGEINVVATGGSPISIAPVSETIEHVEPFLTLHGLRIVHDRNN